MARRTHGSGSVYPERTGGYRATCELPPDPATGRRRRLVARGCTKAVALKRLKDKKLEYERSGRMPSQTTPYLKDWLDRWLDEIVKPRLRPSTLATYRSVVEALIKPAIGGVRLGRLEPKHFRMMEEYITKGDDTCDPPRRPRSSATAGSAWRTLHKALDDAVREGIIESNPCDRAESPRVVYTERKILTPAQAGQLINAENDVMWHLMWRLAYETGMRQGERLGLTNSEIQLIDNVICIVVEWQLKVYNNVKDARDIPSSLGARHVMGKAYLVPPKTNAGRRVIPLPESLAAELGLYIKGTGRVKPDDLVFVQEDGAPLNRMIETRAWKKALQRVGLPGDFVPHSARHTAATAMAQLGMSDKVRESIMGHSDISVTNRVYTHVGTADASKAVNGVETLLALEPANSEESGSPVE